MNRKSDLRLWIFLILAFFTFLALLTSCDKDPYKEVRKSEEKAVHHTMTPKEVKDSMTDFCAKTGQVGRVDHDGKELIGYCETASISPEATRLLYIAWMTHFAPPPAPPAQVAPTQDCQEDMPCWDCNTMGNHICGPLPAQVGDSQVADAGTCCVIVTHPDGSKEAIVGPGGRTCIPADPNGACTAEEWANTP